MDDLRPVFYKCTQARLDGTLKSSRASAQCVNELIYGAFLRNRFPRMDLIVSAGRERLAQAQKVDDGEITAEEGNRRSTDFENQLLSAGIPK